MKRKCGGCFLFPAFARVTTYLTHPGNSGARRNVIPRLCKAGWLRIHKMLPKASFDGADGAVGQVAQPPNMPRSAPYYPPRLIGALRGHQWKLRAVTQPPRLRAILEV